MPRIRPDGLPPAQAAAKLAWLLRESARTGRAGIALKDEQPATVNSNLAQSRGDAGNRPSAEKNA